MQVQVARWGNSLGLRIPKDIAQRAGLRKGARVDVEARGNSDHHFSSASALYSRRLVEGNDAGGDAAGFQLGAG